MLDENLPTYRFQPSSSEPLTTLLYFTHNGSTPEAHYLLKRLPANQANNAYAIGLLDVTYPSLVYAEVAVRPEWAQPTLSAAEIRAQNGVSPAPVPLVPDTFSIHLYNPDQEIVVRRKEGRFGKQDSYEFEVPERTFAEPTGSKLDAATAAGQPAELSPRVFFRWKRDGRLSRDLTCFMCGRTVGGKKSKEPDITVALFRGGRSGSKGNDAGSTVTIYEPNMARVEIEDRKGLEVAMMMSSEVIKEIWQNPKGDVFQTATAPSSGGKRRTSGGSPIPPSGAVMSGAMNAAPPQPPQPPSQHAPPAPAGGAGDPRRQASIDAETRRLQVMVNEERRQDEARERRRAQEQERLDAEKAKRMQKQLEREDKERRKREAEVEKETERLRKQYGVQSLPPSLPHPSTRPGHSPNLPPRPGFGSSFAQSHLSAPLHQSDLYASGAAGGYPARPQSVGPPQGPPQGLGLSNSYFNGAGGPIQTGPPYSNYKPGQSSNHNQNQGKKKSGFGALLGVGKSGNDNGNKMSKRKSMMF